MSAVSRLRRLLRFDLRTMLLLVAFCAVLSAWYRDRQRLENVVKAIQAQRTAPVSTPSPSVLENLYLPSGTRDHVPSIKTVGGFIAAIRRATDDQQFEDIFQDLSGSGVSADEYVPRVIELLNDEDESVRSRAARFLGKSLQRSDIAVPALIESLHDESVDVRWKAVIALGRFGFMAAPAIDELLAIANDDNSPICAGAAYWLLSIDLNAAVDKRLVAMLQHEDDQVRYLAAEAYSHSAITVDRVQPAVPSLIRVVLNDTNPDARCAAAKALSRLPASAAVVDALAKALTAETDDGVRYRLSRALFAGDGG